MRKELPVLGSKHLPIHTMHLLIIETLLFLTIDMVEHIFPFGSKIHLHHSADRNRLEHLGTILHLGELSSQDIEIGKLLIPLHMAACRTYL